MEKFIISHSLKFTPVNIDVSDTGIKTYGEILKGWNTMTFKHLLNNYNLTKKINNNFLIQCTNKFIIFDTDTEEDYKRLIELLKENNLYKPFAITKSSRGEICDYKRHFWFSVSDEKFSNLKKHKLGNMEVFISPNCHIAENVNSTIEYVPLLTWEDYEEIALIFDSVQLKEKIINVIPNPNSETKNIIQNVINDNDLLTIIHNLKPKRFQDYNLWMSIYWTFLNEGFDLKMFNEYSEKHYKDYDEEKNNIIFASSTPRNGFKIATLYHYLKEDNIKIFNKLQSSRSDIWKIFTDLKQHSEPAKLFYSVNPFKYVFSDKTGWYEYNKENILVSCKGISINDVSDTLCNIIDTQRQLITLDNKDITKYTRTAKNAYDKCGQTPFVNCIISFLEKLYTIPDIDKKIDSNTNLFSFNNMLYDNKIKDFRAIKPDDYINKTTGYSIDLKSNPEIRNKLIESMKSMFKTEEMYNYNLTSIICSMFGNKEECFYINSGTGGNGKGVISNMIKKAFGKYFYSGGNTFLTSQPIPESSPNPTLYNLRGVRYFLTTEPESCSETKFNMGVVKMISGNDSITCRTLNKDSITYESQFTPFMQCNTKPKLDKTENSIKRRFKIIDFPFNFVDTPIKVNEKKGDINLKDLTTTQEYINEFMLLLIEINKTRADKIKVPQCVLDEVDNYLSANNYVKLFLDENYIMTKNPKDKIAGKILFELFNTCGQYQAVSYVKFSEMMQSNDIQKKKTKIGIFYLGIKEVTQDEEDYIGNNNELD